MNRTNLAVLNEAAHIDAMTAHVRQQTEQMHLACTASDKAIAEREREQVLLTLQQLPTPSPKAQLPWVALAFCAGVSVGWLFLG